MMVGAPRVVEAEARTSTLIDVAVLLRLSTHAGDPQTTMDVHWEGENLEFDTNRLLQPRPQQTYPSAVVIFGVEHEAEEWLTLRLFVDTGELRTGSSLDPPSDAKFTTNGSPVSTGFFSLERVRELAASFAWQHVSLDIGKRYTQVGDSLIFEDYATGAAFTLDLAGIGLDDWQLHGSGVLVGQTIEELEIPAPLAILRLEYQLSLFESVGAFGVFYSERNGRLHDVLASALSEGVIGTTTDQTPLERIWSNDTSAGNVTYVGVDAHLLPADGLSIRATGAFSFGALEVDIADQSSLTFDLRSWAASAQANYGISTNLGVGAFAFALSGDEPPVRGNADHVDYRAFIGIAPYWTWTGIFFSGGLSQGFFPGRATAAGVNGHGVGGGGGSVEYSKGNGFVELRTAGLWSTSPPTVLGDGGRFYGIETDLIAEWDMLRWLGVSVELDVFWPGSFFPQRDTAFRAIGQLHAHLGD
ncbi:MAG: hypothetical protein A2289_01375 [Deltaproteobacteria bacterium RIFOXYA12_FULL_58_15]|nr:MAG: hypothetical protein A2289_01375 [Deltaproteobacteria bacterium RIFOXYA12_FULL_58_15]OGR14039.1 MAG: hypothetical protein A2341_19030 [Deltaproteobacteria bacterium RIFOXYB12_FULL_58_9]